MMNTNFEKITKRSKAQTKVFEEVYGGRKLNKVKRDRSHKRSWEGK